MWRLQDNVAVWQCDQLQAFIDVTRPQKGLEQISYCGCALREMALLQMCLPAGQTGAALRHEASYVRGNALITSYADLVGHLRPRYCWRILSGQHVPSDVVLLEAIVSIETDSLTASSSLDIACHLGAESVEVFTSPGSPSETVVATSELPQSLTVPMDGVSCMLTYRRSEPSMVFAQMFSTADVERVVLTRGPGDSAISSIVSVFSGNVEKGVIRRVRMRLLMASAGATPQLLDDQWSDLIESPPPLTT